MHAKGRICCGLVLALLAASAVAEEDQGQRVFQRNCETCHGGWGGYGAPGVGNYDAWRPFFRHGEQAMFTSVVNGRSSMAPRGGNPTLSDKELREAVRWIIREVDGNESGVLAVAER